MKCIVCFLIISAASSWAAPTITNVSIYGPPASPLIVVKGTGFGKSAPPPTPPRPPFSGSDFAPNALSFQDSAKSHLGWVSGIHGSDIGLLIESYTDTIISFHFGSAFTAHQDYYSLRSGDPFVVTVNNVNFGGQIEFKRLLSSTQLTAIQREIQGMSPAQLATLQQSCAHNAITAGGLAAIGAIPAQPQPATSIAAFFGGVIATAAIDPDCKIAVGQMVDSITGGKGSEFPNPQPNSAPPEPPELRNVWNPEETEYPDPVMGGAIDQSSDLGAGGAGAGGVGTGGGGGKELNEMIKELLK